MVIHKIHHPKLFGLNDYLDCVVNWDYLWAYCDGDNNCDISHLHANIHAHYDENGREFRCTS